jgi:hypothetical protein
MEKPTIEEILVALLDDVADSTNRKHMENSLAQATLAINSYIKGLVPERMAHHKDCWSLEQSGVDGTPEERMVRYRCDCGVEQYNQAIDAISSKLEEERK